jgi:tetratricopeptide (TPR) repeat protein
MRNAPAIHRAITLAAALLLGASYAPTSSAQTRDPQLGICANGDAQSRVTACSQLLGRTGLDTPTRIAAYVNRGNAHDSADQFDLALKDYQSALDLDSNNWTALRSRAGSYYRRGQLADAARDLSRAVAAMPDEVSPLRLRGQLYAEMGQTDRAIEDFSKVLDRNPGDLQARQVRGLALASAGDHARAILDFNRVLERDPRVRVARAARAFSLFRTRQYRLAILDWDLLLKDDPAQPQIIYCRGAAKLLTGDETGRVDIDTVSQQRPDVAAKESAACPVPVPR